MSLKGPFTCMPVHEGMRERERVDGVYKKMLSRSFQLSVDALISKDIRLFAREDREIESLM